MTATYTGRAFVEGGEGVTVDRLAEGALAEFAHVTPMEVARDLTLHFLRPEHAGSTAAAVGRYYATVYDAVEHPERYNENGPSADPPRPDPPAEDPGETPEHTPTVDILSKDVDLSKQADFELTERLPDSWRLQWDYTVTEPADVGNAKAIVYTLAEFHDGKPWRGRRRLAFQLKRLRGKYSLVVGLGVGRKGGTDWEARDTVENRPLAELLSGYVELKDGTLRLALFGGSENEAAIKIPPGALDGMRFLQVSHSDIGGGSDGEGDEPAPPGSKGRFWLTKTAALPVMPAAVLDAPDEESFAVLLDALATALATPPELRRSKSVLTGPSGDTGGPLLPFTQRIILEDAAVPVSGWPAYTRRGTQEQIIMGQLGTFWRVYHQQDAAGKLSRLLAAIRWQGARPNFTEADARALVGLPVNDKLATLLALAAAPAEGLGRTIREAHRQAAAGQITEAPEEVANWIDRASRVAKHLGDLLKD